jgi:hypothetical protein
LNTQRLSLLSLVPLAGIFSLAAFLYILLKFPDENIYRGHSLVSAIRPVLAVGIGRIDPFSAHLAAAFAFSVSGFLAGVDF